MRIILLGARGHASDVLGAIEAVQSALLGARIVVAGFLADGEFDPSRFDGRGARHLGDTGDLARVDASHFIACAGYPEARRTLAQRATAAGLEPFSVVHPRAWVPDTVKVGRGTIILAGVCISPMALIGDHAYLSHGSLIGHDTKVRDYVSVMPGGAVSGDVLLDEGCTIGSNATVLEKVSVGAWSTVGAGAVVTKDIPPGVVAKGAPARWSL